MFSVSRIATLWPENESFRLDRHNAPDEVVFIFCHTPIGLFYKGKEVICPKNTAVFFEPSYHQIFFAHGERLMHDWMHIKGEIVPYLRRFGIELNKPYEIKNGSFITETIQELELEFLHADILSKEMIDNKLRGFVLQFARTVFAADDIPKDAKSLMQFARTQIHHKYNDNWTAEKMAELVHLSPSRFFFLYNKTFNISPKKDLQRVRMQHAKHLLMQNRFTVKEVAEQIGYENSYFFIRKFKAETGETPGQFKKRFGK